MLFPKTTMARCLKEMLVVNPTSISLIKQAHRMLDKDVLGDVSPIYVQPYVRAYQAMDKIVHKCFGTRVVDEDEVVDLLKELVVA